MDSKNIIAVTLAQTTKQAIHTMKLKIFSAKGQLESSSSSDGHNVISKNLRWAMKMRRQ